MGKAMIIPGADFSANCVNKGHLVIWYGDTTNILTENNPIATGGVYNISNSAKGKLVSITLTVPTGRTELNYKLVQATLPTIGTTTDEYTILKQGQLVQSQDNPLKFLPDQEIDFSDENVHFLLDGYRYKTDGDPINVGIMCIVDSDSPRYFRNDDHYNPFGFNMELLQYN